MDVFDVVWDLPTLVRFVPDCLRARFDSLFASHSSLVTTIATAPRKQSITWFRRLGVFRPSSLLKKQTINPPPTAALSLSPSSTEPQPYT